MATNTQEIDIVPDLELEDAGFLEDGTEVQCNIVLAEDYEDAPTLAIVMGCGAKAVQYAEFQARLATEHGINSITPERLYVATKHPVKMQSEALGVSLQYAQEEYGLVTTNGYGHSWGGGILASHLNGAESDIDLAILHATACLESAFKNVLTDPMGTLLGLKHELLRRRQIELYTEIVGANMEQFPALTFTENAVMLQHMLVASEGKKLLPHLRAARASGIYLAGLWPEYDVIFRKSEHPIFDTNVTMPGSVHTETQSNPGGVAKYVAGLIIGKR